jgi:ubiquinone/menaquinone biosynthesis C-methylase UbiE
LDNSTQTDGEKLPVNSNTDTELQSDVPELRQLILGMRAAFARGENAMEFARRELDKAANSSVATLISYDLQTGSYVANTRANPEANKRWVGQLASILGPFVGSHSLVLEVGCGEATTLAGVLQALPQKPRGAIGFDISWSRCAEAMHWLAEKGVAAQLFVADLFSIPLDDSSVDVVYTSHSIEPNRGRELAALRELLRIAQCAVVLVEPLYELANESARNRMDHHKYVRGLHQAAESLGANILDYRLLEYTSNPLNPSGVLVLDKGSTGNSGKAEARLQWRCPITHTPLTAEQDVFVSKDSGLAYPVLRNIPLLRPQHAIVASKLCI